MSFKLKLLKFYFILFFLSGLFISCKKRDENKSADDWGECYSNIQCKAGLICRNNRCVNFKKNNLTLKQIPSPNDMVSVPAGKFIIGNDRGTFLERPQTVTVTGQYFIDKTEVTVGMYMQCVKEGGCHAPRCDINENPRLPIRCVTHLDAEKYCSFREKRLPIEEEWEKACRGTDARRFPWGESKPDCNKASFNKCGKIPSIVGTKKQGISPYKTLDQAGNVWEWTDTRKPRWDKKHDPKGVFAGYGKKPTIKNLKNKKNIPQNLQKDFYIIRGGSYGDNSRMMRCSSSLLLPVDFFSPYIGFRCAKNL